MENRSKYYGQGKWANHTLKERYEKICWALDALENDNLDDIELDFIIKNAFVSKFYVSENVLKEHPKFSNPSRSQIRKLYNKLVDNGILNLQQGVRLPLNNDYFRICQLGINLNKSIKNKKNNQNKVIVFEHVIPGNIYLDKAKKLQKQKPNNWFDEFKVIFDSVCVCFVTGKENSLLNDFQSSMPNDKYNTNFESYPFARYDKALGGVGIDVHGWDFDKGKLIRKTIII